jgi:hypothetical protein
MFIKETEGEMRNETESRWLAGGKMDIYDEGNEWFPDAELCLWKENREDEFTVPDLLSMENEERAKKTARYDLKELDRQICFRFCQEANACDSYGKAKWLARNWGSRWAKKSVRNWESWAKARNYLNKVVSSRWPVKASMESAFWADKPIRKEFPLPTEKDPFWKWEAVLWDLDVGEEDVLALNTKDMLESLEGIGEKRAEALLEAFEGDSVFDADFQDLLAVEGIGPVTAYKVYGGLLDEDPEPERWVPSERYLAMDPVGTFQLPEEERWDLLGNQNLVRQTGSRMNEADILAWMGDLRK